MMEEAKKMMESSEFKSQMKTLEKSKEFKEAVKKTGDMMKDPSTAARMEAQMEHMLKRGQDTLKQNAAASMTEALDAMNDPGLMADATKMMKDPEFQKNMQKMAQDPAFKNYVTAVSNYQNVVIDWEDEVQKRITYTWAKPFAFFRSYKSDARNDGWSWTETQNWANGSIF